MWARRDPEQIQKCAEASSRRIAFPEELGSLYLSEGILIVSSKMPKMTDCKLAGDDGHWQWRHRDATSSHRGDDGNVRNRGQDEPH
jgi:hypothetical protein